MFNRWYSNWMANWEHSLAHRDTNRVIRPFEWGLDWLGLTQIGDDPGRVLEVFSERAVAKSDKFYAYAVPADFRLAPSESRPDAQTLNFTSPIKSPYPENNTVCAEYFPAANARGRAVVVIPQWNSDEGAHIGLCKLLNRAGISALRLSLAYHHKRMPGELQRADYHVSANLGRTVHAMRQSVIDTRACLDWLQQRGYTRLGIQGTSLGSCVALLAATHDRRPKAGVFNHVSMYVSDVVWTGISCRHIRKSLDGHITSDRLKACWRSISPAPYLDKLQGHPMQSLLIWASHDTTFLPEFSKQVLAAFKQRNLPHSVAHLPCGHYTSGKMPFALMDGYLMVKHLHNKL
jgi:Alpha/beta hydrolase domain containing 18